MGKKIGTDQFAELAAAVLRSLPRDISPEMAQYWILRQDRLVAVLGTFLRNPERWPFPSEVYAPDLIPPGIEYSGGPGYYYCARWDVVEDVAPRVDLKGSDLESVSFLNKGESSVSSEEMRRRAVMLGANLGLADAKFLLEHQGEIPVEMRSKELVFPGTVLREPLGDRDLCIPVLTWIGGEGRWVRVHCELDNEWGDVRLVRCKPSETEVRIPIDLIAK